MSEQALIVSFEYGEPTIDALHRLEDEVTAALAMAGEGECDGYDVSPDLREARLYLYGPDAELLFVATRSILEASGCVHNGTATLRFGPPEDGVEERVERLKRGNERRH